MKKLYLISVIEKYYLNGQTEKVKWSFKNNVLSIKFISKDKNLMGEILAPCEMENCEIGVFFTSQLKKILSILDKLISIKIHKENNIPLKLNIEDSNYSMEYVLADLSLISRLPRLEEPKKYEIEANISLEMINNFLRASKVSEAELFTVETSNKELKLIIGGYEKFTNKISFNIPTLSETNTFPIKFPLKEFRDILEANTDLSEGKVLISEEGLMKIKFSSEEKIISNYILVGKE